MNITLIPLSASVPQLLCGAMIGFSNLQFNDPARIRITNAVTIKTGSKTIIKIVQKNTSVKSITNVFPR